MVRWSGSRSCVFQKHPQLSTVTVELIKPSTKIQKEEEEEPS